MSTDGKTSRANTEERTQSLPETRRLEDFSDAAFSIIITLLVLEIHRPRAAPGTLGEEIDHRSCHTIALRQHSTWWIAAEVRSEAEHSGFCPKKPNPSFPTSKQ
jgi:hypothetical protein